MHLNKMKMKQISILLFFSLFFITCDVKKTNISGKVTDSVTGEPVNQALVNYVECNSGSEQGCDEIVISQEYTNASGEFIVNQKTASKSKRKWLDVYVNNKLVGHQDNIGLKDKNISIQVTL